LSKIFDSHVLYYVSPKSSTKEFWSATRGFQDKPMYSSLDRAQPGGWHQFRSWLDTEVAPKVEFCYHVFKFASFPKALGVWRCEFIWMQHFNLQEGLLLGYLKLMLASFASIIT
jgi:hypothetical protein